MSKRIACLLLVAVLVLTSSGMLAYARQPDRTYTYESTESEKLSPAPSTNVYRVKKIIDETVMGCTRMTEPSDLFVDDSDRTFILDAGNARVLILDQDYRCIKELKDFNYEGQTVNLAVGAKGLFYRESNQYLYIADTENNRILVSDLDGNISKIYGKPVDELLDPKSEYKPKKIIVDNMGIMYVTSGTVNTGAMMMDVNNTFLGFYGTGKLKLTDAMKMEYFWRSILPKAMIEKSGVTHQPVEYYNLFWSEDRFVYAVSPIADKMEAAVVKMNALGDNIIVNNANFVNIEKNSNAVVLSATSLSTSALKNTTLYLADLTVDKNGAYTVLDMRTGRMFRFDENGNLLAIFGGIGYQKGLFTRPGSIECDSQNNLLVLDEAKATITVMEQTYYGQMIETANRLYNEGRYVDSIEPWMDVLRMNANYIQAFVGLGKAYLAMEDYEQAMEFFKNGKDKDGYAEAKAALRDDIVREYFGLIAAIVILAMIFILGYDQIKLLFFRLYWRIRK